MSPCIKAILDLIQLIRSGEFSERWLEAYDLLLEILQCTRDWFGPPMVGAAPAAELPDTLEGVCDELEKYLPKEGEPETVQLGPVAIALVAKLAELVLKRLIDRLVK